MKTLIFSLFFLTLSFGAFAQADSLNKERDLKMYASYTSALPDNLRIFNGREYTSYPYLLQGSPYFLDSANIKGSLIYNDVFYENISLTYDIVKQQLLANVASITRTLIIAENPVSQFNIGSHQFINFRSTDSLNERGYFEVLKKYPNASLLSKRKKSVNKNLEGLYVKMVIVNNNSFYYLRDKQIYKLNTWKSIFQLFPDQKKKLKKLRRTKFLHIKNDAENVIIRAVDFAETNQII